MRTGSVVAALPNPRLVPQSWEHSVLHLQLPEPFYPVPLKCFLLPPGLTAVACCILRTMILAVLGMILEVLGVAILLAVLGICHGQTSLFGPEKQDPESPFDRNVIVQQYPMTPGS